LETAVEIYAPCRAFAGGKKGAGGAGALDFRTDFQYLFPVVWKMIGDNIPYNLVVDAEIGVGNAIAQSVHFIPRHIGIPVFDFVGNIFCRFSNNFKIADHGVYGLVVALEANKIIVARVFENAIDSRQHIIEIQFVGAVFFHRLNIAYLF
jgi:hypothetical protein